MLTVEHYIFETINYFLQKWIVRNLRGFPFTAFKNIYVESKNQNKSLTCLPVHK